MSGHEEGLPVRQGWWSTGRPGLPGQGWPGAALLLVSEPQHAPSAPACNTNCPCKSLRHTQTHTDTNIHTQTQCDSRNKGSTQMLHKACEADAEGLSTLPCCQQRKSTCSDVKSLELIWICLEHSVEESHSLPRRQAGDTKSDTTILVDLMTCTRE